MMEIEGLKKLAAEIQSLGYDEPTARRYASLIGDTPLIDQDGQVIVTDETGVELVRLKLSFFRR